MADEADIANDYLEKLRAASLSIPRPPMEKGQPGECEWCGEETLRIVKGACARCRDKYNLG